MGKYAKRTKGNTVIPDGITRFLVVDLEATCDDGGLVPREEMETIEIGAVLVDAERLVIGQHYATYVRPRLHPQLTPFCLGLTGIHQEDVDAAPEFAPAFGDFCDALGVDEQTLFCSWGTFDRILFERDCAASDVPYPFAHHLDVKARFAEWHGRRASAGLSHALRAVGLTFRGTPHRGLDDALNVARLLPFCVPPTALTEGSLG